MSSTCFKPEGYLHEDGCKYSYGMVRFTCIGLGSLVGRGVYSEECVFEHTLLPTRLLILMHAERTIQ